MSPARFAAHAHRKFRRAGTGIFISAEGIFHNSVFQRMEGDDAEPSTRSQPIDKGIQGIFQYLQLSVAGNPNRLKRSFGGISAFSPHLCRNRRPDNGLLIPGTLNRLIFSSLHDVFGDILCKFIFSVVPDTPKQLCL